MTENIERPESLGNSTMNARAGICLILSCGAHFLIALGLAYWAGWKGTVSFFGAGILSFLAAFVILLILMLSLRVKGKSRYIVAFCVLLSAVISSRRAGFNMTLEVYTAGFKRAAFNTASESEWQSLLPLAEKWFSSQSHTNFEQMLPRFTQQVYPGNPPFAGVAGDPGKDFHVAIFWRDIPNVGFQIGGSGPMAGEFYREKVTNDITVVVFYGG